MEWQPIETAPKDGTHIIVIYRDYKKFGSGRIWSDIVKWEKSWNGWSDDETDYIMDDNTFTHWMLLPEPPKERDE